MGRENDGALYLRLMRLARPYAGWLTGLFVLDLLDGLTVLLAPLPLKIAVDSVIGSHPPPAFLGWAGREAGSASAADLLLLVGHLLWMWA